MAGLGRAGSSLYTSRCMKTDYARMGDEELIRLLHTEEDTLPREAADEIVRRGAAVVPRLANIVTDRAAWDEIDEPLWAPVHATYLLGAIGGPDVVPPLLAALRFSDELEVDWVYDALPSILPGLGDPVLEPLRSIALDRDEKEFVRIVAIDALEAIAQRRPDKRDGILADLRALAGSDDEDDELRGCAGAGLLRFVRPEDREFLERLADEQDEAGIIGWLLPKHVREAYDEGVRPPPPANDWMTFYDPDRIRERQERWEKEAANASEEGEEETEGEYEEIPAPYIRPAPAVGRNAPCPCGSGKKFKKCCGG